MIAPDGPCEVLTCAEMARADRAAAAAGVSVETLMENAGGAVARVAADLVPAGAEIRVFCGPGNNGGDGFVAARKLAEAGFRTKVVLLGDPSRLQGAAAVAAGRWGRPVASPEAADLDACDLAIDALFGAGLTRPLAGDALSLVRRLGEWSRRTRRPIVAVDVPSGFNGDDGGGPDADFFAAVTVTFFRLKPGHLLVPGRFACGRIHLADIGFPDGVLATIGPTAFVDRPSLWRTAFPWPQAAGHKYDRGHVVVASGAAFHTGAARLAARAALRIGAGLVTIASPTDALLVNAAASTAVMVAPCDDGADLARMLADRRRNAVVLGPGLGLDRAPGLAAAALAAGPHRRVVVLDADALTCFAGRSEALAELVAQAPGPVVLTPHEGEFVRLFGGRGFAGSKLDRARAAAAAVGAVVVLKGADTVIAAPDGRAALSAIDAPWLATAGSGDVLAGFVGGLAAQGMPAFEAACAAVHLHADVARTFGPGLIAEDLSEGLPQALAALRAARA